MGFTLVDIVALLLNLCIILFCWILIIIGFRQLKKLNLERFDGKQSIANNFVIGLGSGLMVFILGWFTGHLIWPKLDFSSVSFFLSTLFSGLIVLILQFSTLIVLIIWVLLLTFKPLPRKEFI